MPTLQYSDWHVASVFSVLFSDVLLLFEERAIWLIWYLFQLCKLTIVALDLRDYEHKPGYNQIFKSGRG